MTAESPTPEGHRERTGEHLGDPIHPLMACGCVAMSVHVQAHDGLLERHPTCFTHVGLHAGACVVAPQQTLPAGRRARCSYFGQQTRKSECDHCAMVCSHEAESSTNLPFFVLKPAASFDEFYCGCHSWD